MKKIIVLNHKSELTLPEVKKYLLDVNDLLRNDLTTIICPSNVYIPYFNGKYKFKLGSQTISDISINGEITGKALKSSGVNYAIVGHHERSNYLKEEPKQVNNQIKSALKNGITPIVILGETYYQKELKKTGEVIGKQIKEYFDKVEVNQDIILVYEPNYSFKGKEIPSKEYVTEVVELIKNIIRRKYNANLKVLYGGNINLTTIEIINKIPNIDGLLIGKTSCFLENLKKIFDIIE